MLYPRLVGLMLSASLNPSCGSVEEFFMGCRGTSCVATESTSPQKIRQCALDISLEESSPKLRFYFEHKAEKVVCGHISRDGGEPIAKVESVTESSCHIDLLEGTYSIELKELPEQNQVHFRLFDDNDAEIQNGFMRCFYTG